MIFVDTGASYARYVVEDIDHPAAVAWFNAPPDRLLTTDYIVDELLTLLKVRGYAEIAYTMGAPLIAGEACRLLHVEAKDVMRAWVVFSTSIVSPSFDRLTDFNAKQGIVLH